MTILEPTNCVFCNRTIIASEPSLRFMDKTVCVGCAINIIQEVMQVYNRIQNVRLPS